MTRVVRLLSAAVVVMLVTGLVEVRDRRRAGAAAPSPAASRVERPVLLPVAALAAAQGVSAPDGRLLAAVSRRVLDPRAFPATYLVNGAAVQPTWWTPATSSVQLLPGRDQVERVVSRRVPVPADTRGGLLLPGRPGTLLLWVGERSGEVVSRRLLAAPQPGRLRGKGSVLLTFDDGPDPRWTPQVLDLLKGYGVRAVFCVVGREVVRHAALVRRVVTEGHQLCDHTLSHDEHLDVDPVSIARLEIGRGADAIQAVVGARPPWFRAPGGAWTPEVERYAREAGLTPLKWTVDPRDWTAPPAAAIVRDVLAQARPGGVILLHDGGGDRTQTLVALRRLLRALPRAGLRFADPALPQSADAAPGSSVAPHGAAAHT